MAELESACAGIGQAEIASCLHDLSEMMERRPGEGRASARPGRAEPRPSGLRYLRARFNEPIVRR